MPCTRSIVSTRRLQKSGSDAGTNSESVVGELFAEQAQIVGFEVVVDFLAQRLRHLVDPARELHALALFGEGVGGEREAGAARPDRH